MAGDRSQRWGSIGVVLLCVTTAAIAATGPSASTEKPKPAAARRTSHYDHTEILRRLGELEALAASLKAQLERLRLQMATPGAPPTPDSVIADLERQIAALSEEIDTLKAAAGAPPAKPQPVAGPASSCVTCPPPTPPELKPMWGLAPAASKIYQAPPGLSFGGYGDLLYENFTHTRDDDTVAGIPNRADVNRAAIYFGYRWDDQVLFNSAVALEHARSGDGEPGAVSVEFAYMDMKISPRVGGRAGVLLVPMGFQNEMHEPATYLSTRSPEVERVILPAVWSEMGLGIYGEARSISWRGYMVTSLDGQDFTGAGIRGGRQGGAEAKANNLALTGRIDYAPARLAGLRVGGSFFTGNTGQDEPGFPNGRLSLIDLHGQVEWKGFHLRALYAQGIQSEAGELSLAIDGTGATAIGERSRGWYAEGGWDILSLWPDWQQQLIGFCRYEALNTQHQVAPGFSADLENDLSVRTCGLFYQPLPNIVVKVDAQNFDNRAHTAVDQVNIGLGFSF